MVAHGQPAVVDHKGMALVLASESKAHAQFVVKHKAGTVKTKRCVQPAPSSSSDSDVASPSETSRAATKADAGPLRSPSDRPVKRPRFNSNPVDKASIPLVERPMLKRKAPNDQSSTSMASGPPPLNATRPQSHLPALGQAGSSNLAPPHSQRLMTWCHVSPATFATRAESRGFSNPPSMLHGQGGHPAAGYTPMEHLQSGQYHNEYGSMGQHRPQQHTQPQWRNQQYMQSAPYENDTELYNTMQNTSYEAYREYRD